ncbi:MAG: hypothetical protein WBQ43_12930 [Terriglobales bacterium]
MRPITTNLVFRLQTEVTRPNPATRPFRDLHGTTLPETLPQGTDV